MELDFLFAANEDYEALRALENAKVFTNTIGVLAEQCCEKYLKHLILLEKRDSDKGGFLIPLPKDELHNLTKLSSYLYSHCDFKTPYPMRKDLFNLTRLYQCIRYPNYHYHKITMAEVTTSINTAINCRAMVLKRVKEIENEKINQAEMDTDIER